jgi:subtilisin family serine protease
MQGRTNGAVALTAAAIRLLLLLSPAPSGAEEGPQAGAEQVVFKLRAEAEVDDPEALLVSWLARGQRTARRWRPGELRRVFADRPAPLDRKGPASGLGRVYVSDVPPGVSVEAVAARLAADSRVEYAQPDYVREAHQAPNDPYSRSSGSWGQSYADQWALPKINVEHAWAFSRGEGIVVAVVDSGIDPLYPELVGRMWENPEEQGQGPPNGYPGDSLGWDFVGNDNDPQDEFGHGTHMAGIIAAETDNGIGIAGVAPAARLMAVRVMNASGRGTSSTIAAGIVYAADNGAQVITVSSGCVARCPSDPLVEQAVRHAASKGAILVLSAGNRGDDLAFYSPQNMTDPRPTVVSATDELDRRESFGNAGAYVDLVAPGGGRNPTPPVVAPVSNILSLAASLCSPLVCDATHRVGSQYLRRAGTSMSAAYVSGVVALLLAADPLATPQSVREHLFGNVQDLGPKGFDAMFGWGRVTGLNTVADLRRYILARIVAPSNGERVSGLVRIVGAADARTFSSYEVSVGPGAAPATWQTAGVALVGSPTPQGDLARWNTEGLSPGTWTIRLVVRDTLGSSRESRRTVTVESAPLPSPLVLDVASDGLGAGTIQVDPPRAFCDGVAGSTQTCAFTYASPGPVTLTAVPEGLSAFAGWSGACSGNGPCTVDLAARHDVRATFRGPYRVFVKITRIHYGASSYTIEPPAPACDLPSSLEPCQRYSYRPGTVVTLTAYEGGPLDSFYWATPACDGDTCTLVMDRDWFVEGVSSEIPYLFQMTVSAGPDQRLALGQPATLQADVYNPENLQPLLYSWWDETTDTFLGNTESIAPVLGFGLHDIRVTVIHETDTGPITADDGVRVVVHDPW